MAWFASLSTRRGQRLPPPPKARANALDARSTGQEQTTPARASLIRLLRKRSSAKDLAGLQIVNISASHRRLQTQTTALKQESLEKLNSLQTDTGRKGECVSGPGCLEREVREEVSRED